MFQFCVFAYSGKVHPISTAPDCAQRSSTVSRKASTVSKKGPPPFFHSSGSARVRRVLMAHAANHNCGPAANMSRRGLSGAMRRLTLAAGPQPESLFSAVARGLKKGSYANREFLRKATPHPHQNPRPNPWDPKMSRAPTGAAAAAHKKAPSLDPDTRRKEGTQVAGRPPT